MALTHDQIKKQRQMLKSKITQSKPEVVNPLAAENAALKEEIKVLRAELEALKNKAKKFKSREES